MSAVWFFLGMAAGSLTLVVVLVGVYLNERGL